MTSMTLVTFPRSPSVHWQLFRVGLSPNAYMFFLSLFPMFFSMLRRAKPSAHSFLTLVFFLSLYVFLSPCYIGRYIWF